MVNSRRIADQVLSLITFAVAFVEIVSFSFDFCSYDLRIFGCRGRWHCLATSVFSIDVTEEKKVRKSFGLDSQNQNILLLQILFSTSSI